jgi:HK97 family phage portal protein
MAQKVRKNFLSRLLSTTTEDPDTGFITTPADGNYDGFDDYKVGDEIKKGYNVNDDLYSVVSKVARTISNQIKWEVKETNLRTGEENIVQDTDINKILDNPNDYETLAELREKSITYLMLCGVNYLYGIERGGIRSGYESIHVLPAQDTNIVQGTLSNPIKKIVVDWEYQKEFEPETIGISKYPNINKHNYFGGHSPTKSGHKLIDTVNDLIEAENHFLKNRGVNGMLTNDSDMDIINPTDMEEVQRRLNKQIGGAKKFNTVWATNARLKYQRFEMSPTDMKLLESHTDKIRRICNLFGLDSSLFNDPANKTYNNQKEALKSAFLNVFIPNDKKILDTFNKWLIPKYDFNTDNIQYKIIQKTDHIEALQDDEERKAKINDIKSKEIREIITSEQITRESKISLLINIHSLDAEIVNELI